MTLKVSKYSAEWCAPCKVLGPIFDKITSSIDDVEFEHVDIDTESERATDAGIQAVPTILFEKDGKVVDKIVGMANEQTIRDMITKHK